MKSLPRDFRENLLFVSIHAICLHIRAERKRERRRKREREREENGRTLDDLDGETSSTRRVSEEEEGRIVQRSFSWLAYVPV